MLPASVLLAGILVETPWLLLPFIAVATAVMTYGFNRRGLTGVWFNVEVAFLDTFYLCIFDPHDFGWSVAYTFSGIAPNKIQTAICAHNELPGCAVTLSSESPAAGDAWPRAKKAPQPAPAPRPAPPLPAVASQSPPAVAPQPQPGCSEDTAASTCGG